MEKEENQNNPLEDQNQDKVKETEKPEENLAEENKIETNEAPKEEIKEPTPEEKIAELEDKIARTFAEMENQRRRFEKEKEDAFEYGGYSFAKEALSLIDNLERSKHILENDEKLKNTEALNKTLEHLNIIKKDLISIFSKNNIKPIDCLNKKLDPNKEINRDLLIKAGIIRKNSFGVKLLAKGKLDHKITIKVNKASKKALELVAKIKGNILLEAFKKKESQKDNKMKEK